jgi:acetylornithine deacetylase
MDQETRAKILNAVDSQRSDIVAFLQELIRIESPTGQEGPIQRFLGGALRQIGLRVNEFEPNPEDLRGYPGFIEPDLPFVGRPNLVAVFPGMGGGRSLLLNGHVDTVPLDADSGWIDGPLSGVVRNESIWGRGASDMKAGIAAMTMAVQILHGLGLRRRGDVILEYVVDEERTGLGTLACVDHGYRADAGICCETSDLQVSPACIGRLWFTVNVPGKSAGISSSWTGVSAIEKAVIIVEAVRELERMRLNDLHHPLYPDNRGALPCSVNMFNSGTFPSILPIKAVLRGSLGLMPYEDPKQVEGQLRKHIELAAMHDPWLSSHLPELTTAGGYIAAGAEIPADHPIVLSVAQAYADVTGKPAEVAGRLGAADTRFLIRTGTTPTVIFGPGETGQMHAMNEHVPVENLITATKTLALTMQEWCNSSQIASS